MLVAGLCIAKAKCKALLGGGSVAVTAAASTAPPAATKVRQWTNHRHDEIPTWNALGVLGPPAIKRHRLAPLEISETEHMAIDADAAHVAALAKSDEASCLVYPHSCRSVKRHHHENSHTDSWQLRVRPVTTNP